jgi:hypothetical protein
MTSDYCKKCGNYVTTLLTHDCSTHEPCPSCAALRARVAVLEKENKALEYELKCFHNGNDGDDVHFCGKCDDHVASADIIRAALDAAKEGN